MIIMLIHILNYTQMLQESSHKIEIDRMILACLNKCAVSYGRTLFLDNQLLEMHKKC